jgi:hypothetical protein
MVAHFLFCSLQVANFTQPAGEASPSVLSHILESFSVQKENMTEEQKGPCDMDSRICVYGYVLFPNSCNVD